MRLLHVDSSILGANSVSRALSAEIVEAEKRLVPGLQVTVRDLAANPLLHFSGAHLGAAQAGTGELPPALQHDLALGQAAFDEFISADIVVIGAPMYNFTIPSQLKAWIDRLTVAGKTFKYDENGPRGLCGGKKIIVASSRKGMYGPGTGMEAYDHQEKYLGIVFQFLGVTDVTFIRAEGVGAPEQRAKAMESARTAIANLV